jgi:hypothetical protein
MKTITRNHRFRFALVSTVLLFSVADPCHAKSLNGAAGHAADFAAVFEGVSSDAFKALGKEVSRTIDDGFVKAFVQKFGRRPPWNHRILGHWGFSGRIPFNQEPYKTALAGFPKDEVIRLWQETVNKLTRKAMKTLGLPKSQARALCGIHYDIHLLGDLVPGNKIVGSLPSPVSISDDIVKNAKVLFGKKSPLVDDLVRQLKSIKVKDPQKFAKAMLKMLRKSPMGTQFYKMYVKQLGGRFAYAKLAKHFLKSNPKSTAAVIMSPKKVNIFSKAARSSGVVTFAIDGIISSYKYIDGDINKSELAEELQDASIRAAAVGLAVKAVYILSTTPSGLVVAGVVIVTYASADAVVTYFREKYSGRYLKIEDLRGIASDEFLDNLQPTIEDALKRKSPRRTIAD